MRAARVLLSLFGLQNVAVYGLRLPLTLSRSLTLNSVLSQRSPAVEGDEHYMKLALRHAQFAFREKEVPIGAVIVDGQGRVLAAARNGVESANDATAHAEVLVMRKAAKLLSNWRLHNCTLYTTLEPCAMCFGAIQGFRIGRIVYGAKDHRMGALGSWTDLSSLEHPFHAVQVTGGVLQEEASTLLRRFFQLRRREKDEAKEVLDGTSDYDRAR
jgi:tRNA(adenine34) deaminase